MKIFHPSVITLILAIFVTCNEMFVNAGKALEVATAHLTALTNCNVTALVALQNPNDFVLYLPIASPRTANLSKAAAGWNEYCAGLGGTVWTIDYSREDELSKAVIIGWTITNPGVIAPYVGHDVFFIKRDLIVAQVTTFDFTELQPAGGV
ncbi:hypothetical protein ACA910_014027 [Epithemia clementina (nom. ined.)]